MTPDEAAALTTVGRCKGERCGARIRWAVTRLGNRQPLDADPNPSGNIVFTGDLAGADPVVETLGPLDAADTRERYFPHHGSCPDVGNFKRS